MIYKMTYTSYKRLFDIFTAVICITVFFLPVMLIALLIKLTSKGPAFYLSMRYGKNNKLFSMIKLRTMYINAPLLSSEHLFHPNKYITVLGIFLRKTGIDELPQLLNILKGEMSFVGPRPLINDDKELLSMREQAGLIKLLPGLTGLAQINGRNELLSAKKFEYDSIYSNNISFSTDLKILFLTITYLFNECICLIKKVNVSELKNKFLFPPLFLKYGIRNTTLYFVYLVVLSLLFINILNL